MGRSRILKSEFFRSRSLARCTIPARLTFIGMWTEADDAGRGIADVRVLKGSIWPLDDEVTPAVITSHLNELAATGHVRLYTSDEETYYEISAWQKHQAAAYRRGEPKHPDPSAQSCTILHADECKEVLSLKEFSLKEQQRPPTSPCTPPAPAPAPTQPAAAAAAPDEQYTQAINAAIEIRRTKAGLISHPTRWETSARTGITTDHGERIRWLLNAGYTPEHAARQALEAPTTDHTSRHRCPPRTSWADAETFGRTIAQGELDRGDPYNPDDLVTLCGDREPAWTEHALNAYNTAHHRQGAHT